MTRNMPRQKPFAFHGFNFSDKEIDCARKNDKLLLLELFMSNICNLKCLYCSTRGGTALKNELTLAEYKGIIGQAKLPGAKSIAVSGAGEPLLDKKFSAILDYVFSSGLKTILFTNGLCLNKKIAGELFKKDAAVVLKLESMEKKIHDSLVGLKGSHKKALQALQLLIDAGFNKSNPTRLVIHSTICKQNYKEIPKLFRYARKNNIVPLMELICPIGKGTGKELQLPKKKIEAIFNDLSNIDRKEFNIKWMPSVPLVGFLSRLHYYSLLVDSQGHVRPCIRLGVQIGNIRKKPLKNLLCSKLIKKIRKMNVKELKECFGGNCLL